MAPHPPLTCSGIYLEAPRTVQGDVQPNLLEHASCRVQPVLLGDAPHPLMTVFPSSHMCMIHSTSPQAGIEIAYMLDWSICANCCLDCLEKWVPILNSSCVRHPCRYTHKTGLFPVPLLVLPQMLGPKCCIAPVWGREIWLIILFMPKYHFTLIAFFGQEIWCPGLL